MSIPKLEAALEYAQQREREAAQALAPKHKGGEWETYWAANAELLNAERELASAKGEQYAVPVEFPVKWCTGAPMPHLLQNDHKTFILFLLRDVDPNWDGTYVTVKDPAEDSAQSLGIVEFKRCMATRMGTPNDEVFDGHPLADKGLEAYTAQRVVNSEWIASLQAINSAHHCYNPEFWQQLHHYVLWFHDCSFEAVAESFELETVQSSIPEQLAVLCQRLVE